MKILTEKELAAELGISTWTVRLWRLQLGLPHLRTAGRIFYRINSVMTWMTQEERKNTKESQKSEADEQLRRIAQ